MSAPVRVLAAFDFDGTVSRRDCVVPFLRSVVGTGRLTLALLCRPVALARALSRRDRDALKALATLGAFAGRDADVVRQHGRRFAADVVTSGLRDDTVARLRWHQAQGHTVVFTSASYDAYLDYVGAALGVDAVLCTRLAVGGDGRLTGRLDGPNCRAEEKLVRVAAWLEATHHQTQWPELYAYGDSRGDRELLARAEHPLDVSGVTVSETP